MEEPADSQMTTFLPLPPAAQACSPPSFLRSYILRDGQGPPNRRQCLVPVLCGSVHLLSPLCCQVVKPRGAAGGPPSHGNVSMSLISCLSLKLQPPRPSLSSKGQIQAVTRDLRECRTKGKQSRNSRAVIKQS